MKRILSLGMCLAMVAAAGMAFAATNGAATRDVSELNFAVQGDNVVLTSEGALLARESAGPDTFVLFGGDSSNEGKFQDNTGFVPDFGTWTGADLTDNPIFWQLSTFNAENLNGAGAGNVAYWCGQDAVQAPGWDNTPGYGNNWNDVLLYESPAVADVSVGQTVGFDFFYNHDTEPGYDYLVVEYDSAGTWIELMAQDGSNRDTLNVFNAPGVQFSTAGANNGHGVVYDPNSYGGDNLDQIRIRIRVSSDGAWSDQDGLWPTFGGAAQVDDISVSSNVESFTQDHDVVTGYFVPDKAPFAGDFSDVYAQFTDIDPCIENISPVVGFIDYGQAPPNGPGTTGVASTGGSTGSTSYGIPSGYVVNYEGGLSLGEVAVANEVWSRAFNWDPGVAITNPEEVVGANFRFSVYRHLPLLNGIFYVWHVRSKTAGGEWSEWADRNFVYYGGGVAGWANFVNGVGDLLVTGPDQVQLAFGMVDYADVFGFPGNDATPSPVFDNINFKRYRIGGPVFSTRQIDLANDGFPISGTLDVSTQAGRDALDIPFDMVRDISSGLLNTPGDSIIVDVVSNIPGATVDIANIKMKWSLKTNPVFEDAIRGNLTGFAGAVNTAGTWTGEVLASQSYTSGGGLVDNRFFFDLPDVDFIYPGDHLEFHIEATDSDGRTTTFPGNIAGYGDHDGTYNSGFAIYGLPTVFDIGGSQPEILVWNDFGRRGGEDEYKSSLAALGMVEGVDYDTYTTNGPSSLVGNGLGSGGAHGASVTQVAGYSTILYFSGNLSSGLISDGSDTSGNDKGNDLGLLTAWHALPGDRKIAYFGDYTASHVSTDSPTAGATYVATTMGVIVNDDDVRDNIDNQTAPVVRPTGLVPQFATEFVAYGGCGTINQFDNISPAAGAVASHDFVNLANSGYAVPKAGIVYDRLDGLDRRVDVTFPYSMMYVYNKTGRAPAGASARTQLFEEIFALFNVATPGGSPITGAPEVRRAELTVAPNPFNPQTTVKFANVMGEQGTVKVFNLRGELVKTLHSGEYTSEAFLWDGTDHRGASVASGVYVIQATAGSQTLTKKAALVK